VITLSSAQSVLGPFHNVLHDIIVDAYQMVMRDPSLPLYDPKTRAGMARDHMVNLALQRLVPLGIHPVDGGGMRLFRVARALLLRFKKLNKGGKSNNYPTKQAMLYNEQLPLLSVPHLPRLDIGYTLDKLGNLDRTMIACRNGEHVAWSYDIPHAASSLIPIPLIPSTPPAATPARRILTPKSNSAPKRGQSDADDK
jgi:hypothetical protein